MEWKRSRIVINRWEAHGFRISETRELDGPPFTLEVLHEPDQEPIGFDALDTAKAHADLLNELQLTREDNARLRAELETKNGVWPAPLVDDDKDAAEAYEALMADPDEALSDGMLMDAQAAQQERAEDDFPIHSPAARAAAAELVQALASNA